MEKREMFEIHFACTLPDEPGCGCPDNDFYASYDFWGTIDEARNEAKRISYEKYRGDFTWWITRKGESEILPR